MAAYGAYGEKLLYGKLIEGVIRSTFVIDVDAKGRGTVAVAQYNVKATWARRQAEARPEGLRPAPRAGLGAAEAKPAAWD